ncbi:hypothetical protein [Alteromonas sp. ASW11-130]|nr:hypothetical protein [Alteromonas sp. ASW11-130]MCW8091151.1 hypothetical protein [Alteromonas sp. ASW11-130]
MKFLTFCRAAAFSFATSTNTSAFGEPPTFVHLSELSWQDIAVISTL